MTNEPQTHFRRILVANRSEIAIDRSAFSVRSTGSRTSVQRWVRWIYDLGVLVLWCLGVFPKRSV